MCACEPGFVCSRCLSLPWDAALTQPWHVLSDDEFDRLLDEQARELAHSDLLERR